MKVSYPDSLNNKDNAISTPQQTPLASMVSNLAKKPPFSVTPLSSKSGKDANDDSKGTPVNNSKLWVDQTSDVDSSSSDDDDTIVEEFKKLSKKLKRKAVESPENNVVAAFEKVLTKKQRKKLRKSLEKQI